MAEVAQVPGPHRTLNSSLSALSDPTAPPLQLRPRSVLACDGLDAVAGVRAAAASLADKPEAEAIHASRVGCFINMQIPWSRAKATEPEFGGMLPRHLVPTMHPQ